MPSNGILFEGSDSKKKRTYFTKTKANTMKITNITIEDDTTGEHASIPVADYNKRMITEFDVQPHVSETNGNTPASKVVSYIIKTLEEGKDVIEEIESAYSELVAQIKVDINRTQADKTDKKAEAAEKKAEADKVKADKEAKETEEKNALALTRSEFVSEVKVGADLAFGEFKEELKTLKESLPEGASLIQEGSGYKIAFDAGTTKETIAKTLGYLQQKSLNSKMVEGQIQFWIGDTITAAVEVGVYSTAKEAQEHIAASIKESTGKSYEGGSLAQYQRMADRTPVALRNPEADPTTYLAIAGMKIPRRGEKETADNFKSRLSAFESDRQALQEKVASGEILKRKEVLGPVNEILYKHNLRERPSTEPVMRVGDQLLAFFHTYFGLNSLLGTHQPKAVVYKDGNNNIAVTQEELQEQFDSALANLTNLLYTDERAGLKPSDFVRGTVTKLSQVKVADDAAGKPVYEEQKSSSPVFPRLFFYREDSSESKGTDTESSEDKASEEEALEDGPKTKKSKK